MKVWILNELSTSKLQKYIGLAAKDAASMKKFRGKGMATAWKKIKEKDDNKLGMKESVVKQKIHWAPQKKHRPKKKTTEQKPTKPGLLGRILGRLFGKGKTPQPVSQPMKQKTQTEPKLPKTKKVKQTSMEKFFASYDERKQQ